MLICHSKCRFTGTLEKFCSCTCHPLLFLHTGQRGTCPRVPASFCLRRVTSGAGPGAAQLLLGLRSGGCPLAGCRSHLPVALQWKINLCLPTTNAYSTVKGSLVLVHSMNSLLEDKGKKFKSFIQYDFCLLFVLFSI